MNNPFVFSNSDTDKYILEYINKSYNGHLIPVKRTRIRNNKLENFTAWINPNQDDIMINATKIDWLNKLPSGRITNEDISKLKEDEKSDLINFLNENGFKVRGNKKGAGLNFQLATLVNRARQVKPIPTPKKEIPVATTIDDGRDILKNNYSFNNVDATLNKMDEAQTVAVMNKLIQLEEIFHIGETSTLNLQAVNHKRRTSMAYCEQHFNLPKIHTLSICPRFFKKKGLVIKKTEDNVNSKWFMDCSEENFDNYIITHEYGHLVMDELYRKEVLKRGFDESKKYRFDDCYSNTDTLELEKSIMREVTNRCYNELKRLFQKNNPNANIDDYISDYPKSIMKKQHRLVEKKMAQIDAYRQEVFAEAFANAFCGKPNALGKAMIEFLKENGYKGDY